MSDFSQAAADPVAVSVGGFSYETLAPEQAAVVRAAANGIRNIHKRVIPAIGRYLLTAKEVLPHGVFTRWAEDELGMSARSARNYMAAATWLMGKPASVAVLPPGVLYALAAPGVPDDLVQGVLVDAAKGAPLNPVAIQAKLVAAKVERVELKAVQRRSPGLSQAELRAKREQRRRRNNAKADREEAWREAVKQERTARLTPVVDEMLAAVGPTVVRAILKAMDDWEDRFVFLNLLHAAACDGES